MVDLFFNGSSLEVFSRKSSKGTGCSRGYPLSFSFHSQMETVFRIVVRTGGCLVWWSDWDEGRLGERVSGILDCTDGCLCFRPHNPGSQIPVQSRWPQIPVTIQVPDQDRGFINFLFLMGVFTRLFYVLYFSARLYLLYLTHRFRNIHISKIYVNFNSDIVEVCLTVLIIL